MFLCLPGWLQTWYVYYSAGHTVPSWPVSVWPSTGCTMVHNATPNQIITDFALNYSIDIQIMPLALNYSFDIQIMPPIFLFPCEHSFRHSVVTSPQTILGVKQFEPGDRLRRAVLRGGGNGGHRYKQNDQDPNLLLLCLPVFGDPEISAVMFLEGFPPMGFILHQNSMFHFLFIHPPFHHCYYQRWSIIVYRLRMDVSISHICKMKKRGKTRKQGKKV